MPKNKEPEYRILKFKGKSPPNDKLLIRVTDGVVPDPRRETTFIIQDDKIIGKITPLKGIPKIKRTRKHR